MQFIGLKFLHATTVRKGIYPFLRWCPGAIGLFLRQKCFPCYFHKCGKKVLFGRFIHLYDPHKIEIGEEVVISDHVTLDARFFQREETAMSIAEKVFIGTGAHLQCETEKISFSAGCSVGSFCVIHSVGPVSLGNDVLLAAFCDIGFLNKEETVIADHRPDHSSASHMEINIESGCWLGVRSQILPGSNIGIGAIIGAHSVVHGAIPAYAVAVGNPAAVKQMRTNTLQEHERRNKTV